MLRHEFKKQGEFLFRWRSYLPLLLLPVGLTAALQSGGIERTFGPAGERAWEIFSVLVAFSGLGIRAMTVGFVPSGTSGRNTHRQIAEVVNTTGMYSIVRNPLYLGNFLMLLGCVMLPGVGWFVVVTCTLFALYYERIIYTEEAFLLDKFGDSYAVWAGRTPVFIPNPRLWQAPEMSFSLRTVLRREYSGLYAISAALLAVECACDLLGRGQSFAEWRKDDAVYIWAFLAVSVVYVVLRTLKRNTTVLAVSGR